MNLGKYLVVFLLLLICIILVASFVWYRSSASRLVPHSFIGPTNGTAKLVNSLPNVNLQSTTTQVDTTQPPEGNATTKVKVNGESFVVPPTGTVHKVIQNTSGTTTVDISSSSSTSGTSAVDSSVNVNLNSTTESSSGSESN